MTRRPKARRGSLTMTRQDCTAGKTVLPKVVKSETPTIQQRSAVKPKATEICPFSERDKWTKLITMQLRWEQELGLHDHMLQWNDINHPTDVVRYKQPPSSTGPAGPEVRPNSHLPLQLLHNDWLHMSRDLQNALEPADNRHAGQKPKLERECTANAAEAESGLLGGAMSQGRTRLLRSGCNGSNS
jgi:hypothetical protein